MYKDQDLNGIMLIDKPLHWTSHDVVAKLRGVLGIQRIGYAGTLDPLATGVLPIFIGRATAAIDLQPKQDKIYLARVQFGMSSATGDLASQVTRSKDTVTLEALEAVLPRFVGPQMQMPPYYSAVKMNGEPLYKKARRGEFPERIPRPVTIHELRVIGTLYDYHHDHHMNYVLLIRCSKGTYVRSLVEEIGSALRCPAILASLKRTVAGRYTFHDCDPLWRQVLISRAGQAPLLLRPVEEVFESLPYLIVDSGTRNRLLNGCPTSNYPAEDGFYRVYDNRWFMGVADVKDHVLTVRKLFCARD